MATKIKWAATKVNGSVVASGINLVATKSNTTVLSAVRRRSLSYFSRTFADVRLMLQTASSEVILSAGSIQTPQLLELSGGEHRLGSRRRGEG